LTLLHLFYDLVVFEVLSVIVLYHSVDVIDLLSHLLLIGQTVERRYDIFNFGIADLQPILLAGLYLLLLGRLCDLLNRNELLFSEDHSFLRHLDLGSPASGVLLVELLRDYGLGEFRHEEGFIFVFEEVG
jgi:hypothetical protein